MTSPRAITFMAGVFMLGLILSFVMGGVWFDSSHQALLGSLTAIKMYPILGMNIPWINVDFFTVGIPKLLQFDFAFFGGSYGAFQYFLYIFSIGVVWGITSLVIGIIYNFWSRGR